MSISSQKMPVPGGSGINSKRTHMAAFWSKEAIKSDCTDPLFWGPYLSERQWGTIREDYSPDGSCWDYLTYKKAVKMAYRWGEDGLLGVCDKFGLLCSSLALWNENDSILKERLFGLNGLEGNHGEDVKELYYYLDNVPNHSYMRALYKYPHNSFPYEAFVENRNSVQESEYEILDTGVFENNEYWDIQVEYAKPANHTLICKYSITNKSSKTATLHILPQFYFRNTLNKLVNVRQRDQGKIASSFQYTGPHSVDALYDAGICRITFYKSENVTLNDLLFTYNETVEEEVVVQKAGSAVDIARKSQKDAFHRYIIHDDDTAVREERNGTKCCAWMSCQLEPDQKAFVYWQILPANLTGESSCKKLDQWVEVQKKKAEEFYKMTIPKGITANQITICRQAIAGLLWSKQFYSYNVETKIKEMKQLHGDSYFKTSQGKKMLAWSHLDCQDIILMPDKWEFPWFAAWDLAIHCVLFAPLDLAFAQQQVTTILSDRYMHPNGQVPSCEFDLSDPNPPILAWAVCKIHRHEKSWHMDFIKLCYPRLLISYQWWHKMDKTSSHLFGPGFLGLDNISVIDRSHPPYCVQTIKQADATGWMGLCALNMLQLTLEQCKKDVCLIDMAIRFLRDFLFIAKAINAEIDQGGLWCEEDGFYYDVINTRDKEFIPIRLKSWSGIIPLLACAKICLKHVPTVKSFLLKCDYGYAPYVCKLGEDEFFLTLVPYSKLKTVLYKVFSEKEFLSPYGIRSLSKVYHENPYTLELKGQSYTISYKPGESDTNMFGGNSNWRGPIWLCMNYLFVECMESYAELNQIFTHPLSIVYPSEKSSLRKPFLNIASDLCHRIISLYTPDSQGLRPAHGKQMKYLDDDWKDLVLFYEYFHAETGRGCGASHQTGWSALYLEFVRKLSALNAMAKRIDKEKDPGNDCR